MQEFPYGFGVRTGLTPGEAEKEVKRALAEEGFGVLTEIDVAAVLKARLGVDIDPYSIFGACSPALAHRALGLDPQVGLLLPCNVVVYVEEGATMVVAMDPAVIPRLSGKPGLDQVAVEAGTRMRRALARLEPAG
jgi:uncharacterized protein (DUF302 family)